MVILGAGHTQLKIFCEEVARIPILSLVRSQLKDTKNGIYRNQNYFAMKRATVILGAGRNLFSAANLTKTIIFCHKRDLFHQQTFIKNILKSTSVKNGYTKSKKIPKFGTGAIHLQN